MNCAECKERLYPENPEIGVSHKGRYYPPLCQGCPNQHSVEHEVDDLKDRLNNLEAISAKPGRIPRQYNDRLQEMHGEITYLHNRVNELTAKKRGRSKYD